jgi:TetR/AcrR family transcriptional repressor of bet genes
MARPSNTDERRAQITRGLIEVMAQRGYDGASIADIARAARLTPGLVHYHFENKREILLAALHELVARHDTSLEARLAPLEGDPSAQVAAFIDVHLALGSDADPEALACWILLSGEALRERTIRVEYEKALGATTARLASVIRRGVEARVFRCDAIPAAASALVAAIQGYLMLSATARALIPKGSAAASVKLMAAGLLQPTRAFANPKARR